jgi:hypothetical protein
MKPIQLISQDLFDKVRSRFTNLEMGDETGAVTIDPVEARFFDFDFVNEGVDLGRVSISLNDLGSLKIYYSQGITENQDDNGTQMWYNFLKEMRLFAMRRLLRFDTRDIAKTNLDKNDFQHLAATQGPKEEPDMNTMNETKKIKKGVAEGLNEFAPPERGDGQENRFNFIEEFESDDGKYVIELYRNVESRSFAVSFHRDNMQYVMYPIDGIDAGDLADGADRYVKEIKKNAAHGSQEDFVALGSTDLEVFIPPEQGVAEGLQEGRREVATGTPDAINAKIEKLGLGPYKRESTGSGGEAIFVFNNPNYSNYYISQRQDGNWILYQTNAEAGKQGVAGGGAKDRQWSNKDMERLRVATRDFDDIMASDGPDQDKHDLIKKRIQTKPMAGPKGQLPEEQGAAGGLQESRWNHKSSSKTSRAVQGKTEVVVRHVNKVAETYPGARSQGKNIKAIFIQNADGERAKYPFIHLAGAFAMAQHVDHGGVPHDPAGKAIIKMSEDISKLGEFQRHIQRSSINADAHGIAERAIGHMNELKAKVAALGKRHHYQAWREDFEMSGMGDNTDELVLDAVTLEDYKNKFTQTNFQEELVGFFPLLHSIMREANTVDLEEYVSEKDIDEATALDRLKAAGGPRAAQNLPAKNDPPFEPDDNPNNTTGSDGAEHGGHSRARHLARQAIPKEKSAAESIEKFEEWAESTEQGKLTPDQLNNLKAAIEALPQGPQGPQLDAAIANDFFNDPEKGLTELPNFEELTQALQDEEGRNEEIRATPLQLFQAWATDNNPDLLASLGMTGAEEPAPAPETPPSPAPEAGAAPAAPEQPVAEGGAGGYNVATWYKKNGDQKKLTNWLEKESGLPKNSPLYFDDADLVYGDKTIVPNALINSKLRFNDLVTAIKQAIGGQSMSSDMPVAEGKGNKMVQEVAKIVKSFYNQSNESVGPFRAPENIALDCKKQVTEKFGEKAGEQAYEMAEAFINKLTQEWHQKHGHIKSNPVDHDGLSIDRLKELVGNIKAKVEGMAEGDGKPNSWMEPNMRKDFENAEISSFLLYNIRMIYRWAKEGRNIRDYIQDLKKLEHENISKPTTAAAFKFIMDNLASGEVTDPKMIMQIADKAHTLMGHSDIEQATREGVDKSQVPAVMRKEKGGDWKMSTQDLEKERDQSRTTKPGLDAHAAKMGVGQQHQHESAELASIRKLAGLGEGSGPKEKRPFVDRASPKSQAKIQAARDKITKDEQSKPGKELADKINKKK